MPPKMPSVATVIDRDKLMRSMQAGSMLPHSEVLIATDMALKAVDDARERFHEAMMLIDREDTAIQSAVVGLQLLEMMCAMERQAFVQLVAEIGGQVRQQQPDGGHVDITDEVRASIHADDTTKH
jgi:hypothetical protein